MVICSLEEGQQAGATGQHGEPISEGHRIGWCRCSGGHGS